ncbi:MAG: MFS transporter [Lentisphaerae bacterium]|nr:MFS transporter [Lentisphaerota bacterium]
MSLKTGHDKVLFWGCFIALIATAFGFIIRALIIGDWGAEFNLTPTQQGEIFGVGLWPFAISIVLFSLIIDKVGYKSAMMFGFICHVVSMVVTITARSYQQLYWGMFIVALGNGTVEAYINPVVATLFSKDKTKWLNMLHAGWPGGLVLGGVLTIVLGAIGVGSWKVKILLLAIPTMVYFIMLIGLRFPVNERVAAGVSYRDMLREVGAVGIFIIAWMIASELARVMGWSDSPVGAGALVALVVAVAFGVWVRSLGRPLYIFLLLVMVLLATTELGVDSWVTELMKPAMGKLAPWILVYTSAIMMVLRFCAGPIVHKLSPLGTLALCAGLAALGLVALSAAPTAGFIVLAATLYAVGKTFFWPTTLGVVAEQFPRGGALTLNAMGGVGMLGVGVLGAMLLGNIQDRTIDATLSAQDAGVHAQVTVAKHSLLGEYHAVDQVKVAGLAPAGQDLVKQVQDRSKKIALKDVALLPAIMLVAYLVLIGYFRGKGGYKPVDLSSGTGA